MAKFSPDMLVPAGAANASAARSSKDVALANIAKMKAQFANPDEEGKRNFEKVEGNKVEFTIRVNNTALTLATTEGTGGTGDVKKMSIPSANFLEALDWYADRVRAGEFDAQLDALQGKREARTSKMRETRAAKPKADKKPS